MTTTTNQLLKSSAFLLLAKTAQRSLSIISVLVLARLLSPEDFAIVAISALLLYFCETLSSTGSEPYIVRKRRVIKSDLSTAWTLDLTLKLGVFLLFALAIPFIADFYQDGRLEPVLYVTSTILLINAAKSPGIIVLKRNLQYRKIFYLMISQKAISFCVTISIAFLQKSYWALIIGDICAALTLCVGSYIIHSFRPRLSLRNWKDQWLFSKWILFRASVGYGKSQMDSLLVSKFFNPTELGAFYMSKNLSTLPSTDIIGPVVEPLLATFSKSKEHFHEFNQQLSKAIFLVGCLIVPIGVYMIYFPEHVINLLFGAGWDVAYSILPPLSATLIVIAVSQVINQAFVALGKVRQLFIYEILGVTSLGIVLFLSKDTQIDTFSWIRASLSAMLLLLIVLYFRLSTGYSVERPFILLAPISLIAVASGIITGNIIGHQPDHASPLSLFVSCSIFSSLFATFGLTYIFLIRKRMQESQMIITMLGKAYNSILSRAR